MYKSKVQLRISHALGSAVCDCSLYRKSKIGSRSGNAFKVQGVQGGEKVGEAELISPLCLPTPQVIYLCYRAEIKAPKLQSRKGKGEGEGKKKKRTHAIYF